jgi:hypothetical protein
MQRLVPDTWSLRYWALDPRASLILTGLTTLTLTILHLTVISVPDSSDAAPPRDIADCDIAVVVLTLLVEGFEVAVHLGSCCDPAGGASRSR